MSDRDFRRRLEDRVVVFDGGMGTLLYERGVFISQCFDELNLSQPALVKAVHADYVAAGADVIETNTFGANAVKLEQHGFKDNLAEINYKGAKLAREAAGSTVYVAGAIGPLSIRIEPWGPTSVDEAKEMFRDQAEALLEGGVDLIVLETFSDLNEIWQAIRAVRELSTGIPIVAQMSLGEDGDSLYGTAPEMFARRLEKWGADVIGVNCSVGPAIMLDALERMSDAVDLPLSAMPNAGLPKKVDGRNIYLASPEYMASYVTRFVDAGARVVGGCCGTTPAHIRAIQQALRFAHRPTSSARPAGGAAGHEERPRVAQRPRAERSGLAALLETSGFPVAVEVTPPRGLDHRPIVDGIQRLRKSHGLGLVVVSETARTSARMTPQALAQLLERETGIETLFHLTCRDRELLEVQSDLLGAYALGLRNVICETGAAPTLAEQQATSEWSDLDSIGVTNMVRRLNEGYDLGESPIGSPTGWHLGVVVNPTPTAITLQQEVHRFEWKVDAGADFCVTRPVFDRAPLAALLERIEHCRIPLLVGIRPLLSSQDAEFLANEVPGTQIPQPLLERMRAAEPAGAKAEGIAIAKEILANVRDLVDGVVVAIPGDHYDAAAEILESLA